METKKSTKDSLLKVRLDSETLEKIDEAAKLGDKDRSKAIREIIPIISSKKFEEMISLDTLYRLEKYSIDCSNYFKTSDFNVALTDVSENFPAFVSRGEPDIVHIKYPTFKIRILMPGSSDKITERLNSLLGDVKGTSQIYLTQCYLASSSYGFQQAFLPELMCLNETMHENNQVKDLVCEILKENNIQYEVWPGYCIVGQNVRIVEEDGTEYVRNLV